VLLHDRRPEKRDEPRNARFVEDPMDGREAAKPGGRAAIRQ
jgi:hypothetical protein